MSWICLSQGKYEHNEQCQKRLKSNDNVKCIAYLSTDCAKDKGILDLEAGEYHSFSKGSRYTKSIESLSVKGGCQLTVWKGKFLCTLNIFIEIKDLNIFYILIKSLKRVGKCFFHSFQENTLEDSSIVFGRRTLTNILDWKITLKFLEHFQMLYNP